MDGRDELIEALKEAARDGDLDAVASLLASGADPNASDSNGTPMLQHAALCDQIESMSLLVEKGADVEAVDSEGMTAAMAAAWFGCHRALAALLDMGASPRGKDKKGSSALHLACSEGLLTEALMLCESGGFTEEPNEKGLTPLDCAVKIGYVRLSARLAELSSQEGLDLWEARWAAWARSESSGEALGPKSSSAEEARLAAHEVYAARALSIELDRDLARGKENKLGARL